MLKAELRRLLTTRATYGLWIGAVVVVVVGAFSTISSASTSSLSGPVHEQTFFLLTSVNLSLFALLIGTRSITDEYRHGTIAWSFVAVRSRARLLLIKSLVAGGYTMVVAATAWLVGVAAALATASSKGGDLELAGSDLWPAVGLTAASAAWAILGVHVGALIRQQVPAVVTGLIWVLAVENLGVAMLGGAGRLLPGQAAHAIAHAGATDDPLPVSAAGAILLLYVAATAAAAALSVNRRPLPPQI